MRADIYSATGALEVDVSENAWTGLGTRAVYVGTGGDLKVTMADGQTVTFANIADGSLLPIQVIAIDDSSDASDIVVLL